jgi:hypothetical protein
MEWLSFLFTLLVAFIVVGLAFHFIGEGKHVKLSTPLLSAEFN